MAKISAAVSGPDGSMTQGLASRQVKSQLKEFHIERAIRIEHGWDGVVITEGVFNEIQS